VWSQNDCPEARDFSRRLMDGVWGVSMAITELQAVLQDLHASVSHVLAAQIDTDDVHRGGHVPVNAPVKERKRAPSLRHVNEMDLAQHRVLDGRFGVCVNCGRPISLAKLRAHPDAELCAMCDLSTQQSP
jgi:DnaK suppressor protein